ncbi:hypothetical protein QYM36_010848, partial [Artemia franciscana]
MHFSPPTGPIRPLVVPMIDHFFVLEGTKYKWENFNSTQRVELFFAKLAECEMQGSSRNKYTQGLDFITTHGKEGPKNLDIACVNSVVKALGHLDKRQCSMVTAERRRKEHQWAFNPHSFNSEDYRKLKDGVADFMVPGLWRLSRNKLRNEDLPNLTAYVCFQVSFMFGHQPGVPENMTVQKFMNQHLIEEEGMYVILVEKHKTASIKSAGVAISLEEETIFRLYMKLFRPALLKSGLRVPQNFLLSQKGEKLAILKSISEKRGLGSDVLDTLTDENFDTAVRQLGYKDTLPSLVHVWQKYNNYRIRKTYPVEPVVEETLTQCVLHESWVGLTVAKSHEKEVGLGVFASLPFWENQVVIEYHGKRMATVEANRIIQAPLAPLAPLAVPVIDIDKTTSSSNETFDRGISPAEINETLQENPPISPNKTTLQKREIQIHYGFKSGERKFNNEVIDKPLDYINETPVVGPGYDIVPERFWYEETQLNWDHCKECNCQDYKPDLSNPLGKVAYYWLDQNYLAVLKLFLQTVLEQNRRTIDEHGKFICLSNHFESPVMSIYGPGEDSGERKFNNEVIDKPLDYINEAPVVGPGYDIVPERFWYEETQLNWDHCKECNCQDYKPDLSNPLGKVAYYWLDQNYLAVLKLFLQTVLEQNRRTIDEHGKFICLSNHFESPVMSIYGPGED